MGDGRYWRRRVCARKESTKKGIWPSAPYARTPALAQCAALRWGLRAPLTETVDASWESCRPAGRQTVRLRLPLCGLETEVERKTVENLGFLEPRLGQAEKVATREADHGKYAELLPFIFTANLFCSLIVFVETPATSIAQILDLC